MWVSDGNILLYYIFILYAQYSAYSVGILRVVCLFFFYLYLLHVWVCVCVFTAETCKRIIMIMRWVDFNTLFCNSLCIDYEIKIHIQFEWLWLNVTFFRIAIADKRLLSFMCCCCYFLFSSSSSSVVQSLLFKEKFIEKKKKNVFIVKGKTKCNSNILCI